MGALPPDRLEPVQQAAIDIKAAVDRVVATAREEDDTARELGLRKDRAEVEECYKGLLRAVEVALGAR